MKVLFATSNVQLNNDIIELLHIQQNNVLEIDYLEDSISKVMEFNPDLIVVSDQVKTRKPLEKKGKRDAFLFQQIKHLQDWDTVFLSYQRNESDNLIGNLLEKDFFNIISVSRLESIIDLPKTKEDVRQLLGDDDLHILVKESNEECAFVPPPIMPSSQSDDFPNNQKRDIYLPSFTNHWDRQINSSRAISTVFWSPIPNVGVGSFIRSLANYLGSCGRKVLIIEFDWEYPKIARQTGLTHHERTLRGALTRIANNEEGIEGFVVNNKIAEDSLPHTHKNVVSRLRLLSSNFYVLSRNAELKFEEPYEIQDEKLIERLFFEAKEAGFQHIFVDVPSSPNDLFTSLSILAADEIIAIVDDSFSTSGIFKIAMQGFESIGVEEKEFQLIITKVQDGSNGADVAEFYGTTPAAILPYDPTMVVAQNDLRVVYGDDYMKNMKTFARRYGITSEEIENSDKKKTLFGFLHKKAK
ncbi:hypothetical protein BLGI_4466 [Brevibacillus laterosporus GI-9]|uniref:MinD/ParA family ATP-binding protein n=1 Tax=Brevibacillus laterosporus TaxID=1465 RepID=UPI00024051F6|nr:hypothetical protein [Brevibacillus laterosporus]CCF16497.1 hypothetical protein BLGI_4466 [Brevibacillus laterosporus GI-9]